MAEVKRRWRDYRTEGGQRPVKDFLMGVPDDQRAAILDAMALVREKGQREGGARKLRGRIWEVRVDQGEVIHRITFASVSGRGRILLSLDGFEKKTQKTPAAKIDLATKRLKDWEDRGKKENKGE
ncbi:MAG: type II toxin-antitoxin system RelE/ParE family toxin [Thermoleophilaceae bacterium]|jgi:phage-related protein|nr:type II toxin-antitoxin system RelE/ParE family toxin [Thermoleophilaceae bacterium]